MTKNDIIGKCISLIRKHKKIPVFTDFISIGISRNTIRHHFGNITKLVNAAYEYENTIFDYLLGSINFKCEIDKKLYIKTVNNTIKNYKNFVITSYVNGSTVNKNFYKVLKRYCKDINALLLIIPIFDSQIKTMVLPDGTDIHWFIDDIIKDELFLLNNVNLNDNLLISNLYINAVQVNPLASLHRLSQKNGSMIYGSPKQSLDSVATSNLKIPSILLTTGAINNSNYLNKMYSINRTKALAEHDHILGAISTNIIDKKIFNVRHLQFKKNSICDYNKIYTLTGIEKNNVSGVVFGDLHNDELNLKAYETMKKEITDLKPKYIFIHDLFNGSSVNHHVKDELLEKTLIADRNQHVLEIEINECAKTLKNLLSINDFTNIVIVKSNHDEFLYRYLESESYTKDFVNKKYAIKLVDRYLQSGGCIDPLKLGIIESGILTKGELKRIIWLKRDEDFKLYGIECGSHGDLGANGSVGSPGSLEKAFGNCIVGHGHTPMILRGYWRVGVNCKLRQHYTKGPSGWLHADILVHKNGGRQLIIKIL